MLLSFAQFEREVTAERIRDKIAASKVKGMWMGGMVPLGYRPDGRTLAIVDDHARVVRELYARYLELGNVTLLKQQLDDEGAMVPLRTTSTGRSLGGGSFSRGQLYKLLTNPIYIGKIVHKDMQYDGLHEPIIDGDLWERVQTRLNDNRQGAQHARTVRSPSLLTGCVNDDRGQPLIASHACKGKVRYRYYISKPKSDAGDGSSTALRIPAKELENAVKERLATELDRPLALIDQLNRSLDAERMTAAVEAASSAAQDVRCGKAPTIRSLLNAVEIGKHEISITLEHAGLSKLLGIDAEHELATPIVLVAAVTLKRTGMAMRLVQADGKAIAPLANQAMVDLLVKARRWWRMLNDQGISVTALATQEGITASWISRVIRLNFLAPQIVTAILSGDHPATLDAAKLSNSGILPTRWNAQMTHLGFD